MDFSEKSLFIELPIEHYQFDEENYPSPKNSQTKIALLPVGCCYGFGKNSFFLLFSNKKRIKYDR